MRIHNAGELDALLFPVLKDRYAYREELQYSREYVAYIFTTTITIPTTKRHYYYAQLVEEEDVIRIGGTVVLTPEFRLYVDPAINAALGKAIREK